MNQYYVKGIADLMKLSYETAQVVGYVLIINGPMKRQLPIVMQSLTRITNGNLRQQ